MAHGKVTADEIREMLADLANQIERGSVKSATLRFALADGDEQVLEINAETEEDRIAALLAIRTVLGQVH